MNNLQKVYLERISDLTSSIFLISKIENSTETQNIKTLAELIDESVEKIKELETKK